MLATTIRLWWQRRGRGGRSLITAVAVLIVLLAAGTITVALTSGSGRVAGQAAATTPASSRPSHGPALSPAEAQAAATARAAAASWVARRSPRARSWPATRRCAPTLSRPLPAGQLLYLGVGTASPVESGVLVATATVRQEYGAPLASVYAPSVLASFGTGTAQVAIRW